VIKFTAQMYRRFEELWESSSGDDTSDRAHELLNQVLDEENAKLEQLGPICPHCQTKPAIRYAIAEEEINELNGDTYKCVYCDDCKAVLGMQFVGKHIPTLQRLQREKNLVSRPARTRVPVDFNRLKVGGPKQ